MLPKTFVSTALILALSDGSALAKEAPTPPPPPYTTVGLEKYAQPGTCEIFGKAVVDTKTFGPLAFSGQKVHLLPLIDYAVWYVRRLAELSPTTTLRYPAELSTYTQTAVSDSEGNFEFDHLYCGSYLIEMFTNYENDSNRVESRTVYSTNSDDLPTSMTTQRIRAKIRRETDVAAATAFFTHEDERMTPKTFSLLGFLQCCDGEF